MSDEQIIEIQKQIESILTLSDGFIWQDLLRVIGGGIVYALMWLNSFMENIIDKIITFNDFYASGPMQDFMDIARPIVWGLFAVALFVLGFQFMFNKIEKRNEILLNIIMALCMIVVIPDLMTNFGKITSAGIEQINREKSSLAAEMVKSNVADVLYYAEKDFKFSSRKQGDGNLPPRPTDKNNAKNGTSDFTHGNQLSVEALAYIPFTQKLDLHEDDSEGRWFKWTSEDWVKEIDDVKDVLKNRVVATGKGNEFYVEPLEKNMVPGTKIGRETFYRYHVNWGVLIFSLAVTTLALTITIIKVGRSIFDLAFHQIFGMFIAATDLTGGQRTKKVLVEMMNTFAVIFIMMMLLKIFILYSTWANGLKVSIGGIGVLLLLIAGAWALIDAPDIVARMLGIDAGLRSGWQAAMGAYAGVKTAGALGKGATKLGAAGVGAMAGGANFARRTISGMMHKNPDELANQKGKQNVQKMPGMANPKDGNQGNSSNKDKGVIGSQQDNRQSMNNSEGVIPSQGGEASGNAFDEVAASHERNDDEIPSIQESSTDVQVPGQEAGSGSTSEIPLNNKQEQSEIPCKQGVQGKGSGSITDVPDIPSGYTQTPSGIIVPTSSTRKEAMLGRSKEGSQANNQQPMVGSKNNEAKTVIRSGKNEYGTNAKNPNVSGMPSDTSQTSTDIDVPTMGGSSNNDPIVPSIPSGSSGQGTNVSSPNAVNPIPSGYGETASGIVVPTKSMPNTQSSGQVNQSNSVPNKRPMVGSKNNTPIASINPIGRSGSETNVSSPNAANPMPSGYSQTASGIVVPTNSKSSTQSPRQTNQQPLVSSQSSVPTSPTPTAPSVGSSHHVVQGSDPVGVSSGTSSSPTNVNVNPVSTNQPVATSDGGQGNLPYGHKTVGPSEGMITGNPGFRKLQVTTTQAGNTGFSLGQNIRRSSRAIGRATVQTARAVTHPVETIKYGGEKIQQAVGKVQHGTSSIKQKGSSIMNEIKRPPGTKKDD